MNLLFYYLFIQKKFGFRRSWLLEVFLDEQHLGALTVWSFPECCHHSQVARFSNNMPEHTKSCANQLYLATCAITLDTEVPARWINDQSGLGALLEDFGNWLLFDIFLYASLGCHVTIMEPEWSETREPWPWLEDLIDDTETVLILTIRLTVWHP